MKFALAFPKKRKSSENPAGARVAPAGASGTVGADSRKRGVSPIVFVPVGAAAATWAIHCFWEGVVPVGDDFAFCVILGVVAVGWLFLVCLGRISWKTREASPANLSSPPAAKRPFLSCMGRVSAKTDALTQKNAPLMIVAIGTVALWELITAKSGILPLPFFPGPERVFYVLFEDADVLLKGAYHSLWLLSIGFGLGSVAGFFAGVCFGWSKQVRYWGMPVLKFFGPVPATAWIPLALVLSPSAFGASAFILALASFFPMVMLTSSGVASVRHSHLEIARTLGATDWQLVRRVAIPSALPSIFIGLFIALSCSCITLVVAEMIGTKAGLGLYMSWAQSWVEYHKMFAAILIMGVFFSSLMALFFRLRDRVLRWQQGLIKW
ncbi:MAG: ABC transporter permease [Puniceicoccales bacterium]|nr:ABC transporter permease [Puniceicoccales bacterium]